MAQPSVVQAGQMMLIFALILIFVVCCAVALHLHLRRQRRKRRKSAKKEEKVETKETEDVQESELQSKERNIAELVGTPMCEMGDSEPRHEMEDAEVPERYTMIDFDLQNPADTPVATRTERELEEGTYFGEMTSREDMQPAARVYAAYWSRAI